MKKVFMFAAMFAAVALVACGGEQPKDDKAAEAPETEVVETEEAVVEEAEEVVSEPEAQPQPQKAVVKPTTTVKSEAKKQPTQMKLDVKDKVEPSKKVNAINSEKLEVKTTQPTTTTAKSVKKEINNITPTEKKVKVQKSEVKVTENNNLQVVKK